MFSGYTIALYNSSIYLNVLPNLSPLRDGGTLIAKYSINNPSSPPETLVISEEYRNAHTMRFIENELIICGGKDSMWIVKLTPDLSFKQGYVFEGENIVTDDFGVSDKYYFIGTETTSPSSTAGNIYRVSKSDLGKVVTINTGVTEGPCYGVQEALGYIWAVYGTSPGILVRIDPVSMEVKRYQLEYNLPNEIVSDGKRLLITYWGQEPGIIQSFDLEYLKGIEMQ